MTSDLPSLSSIPRNDSGKGCLSTVMLATYSASRQTEMGNDFRRRRFGYLANPHSFFPSVECSLTIAYLLYCVGEMASPILQRIIAGAVASASCRFRGALSAICGTHGTLRPRPRNAAHPCDGWWPFRTSAQGGGRYSASFYCTLVARRIVMLHQFIKKSQKTPRKELEIARKRMKEVKDAEYS